MRHTKLTDTFSVSEIGLGCSSMSHGYGPKERDDEESVRVIHRAVELGIDIFDTADAYGPFSNERLLGRALAAHSGEVRIATKCGLVARPDGKFGRDGRPEYLRSACEGSLRRLGVEAIDLYQLHRVDPAVPLAESWGALGELVTEGKVRRLGISHATCEELEQIHAIFPITAVQYEFSVWATHSLDDILPWSQKHGVGFLAFAPIGRGYLSGRLDHEQLQAEDSRQRDPRFASEAMRTNQAIVRGLHRIAARHDATPAQVAIAWTLTQGDNVVPIPGTRHVRWLEENAAAADLQLTEEDLKEIDALPAATGEMSWDRTRFATELPEEAVG
ncbi:aldo/keto reductase [Actinosynnema sp. NPDC047251]|uniref:Aldo/keto reductase n=1 Tax=Saccharothrix espanaensis (strain ATCC 51144 / DSM 44229 / JCM 9112 / NBRC 15066 / NRRL 15764) TaxID=1179773 RepID=K0JYX6_SACES|nr:aldo/keto reductase [Saccharothrix espanaensis]CCH33140.1 Aldo/keto reductase [Saccharothrix espanaensis DSM 44229]